MLIYKIKQFIYIYLQRMILAEHFDQVRIRCWIF